jgi:hypothetical protein
MAASRSVAEILAAAKAIKLDLKPQTIKEDAYSGWDEVGMSERPIRYPRITRIYCVLAPVGYEWQPKTFDVYEGDPPIKLDTTTGWTIVFHGHPVGNTCFAPNFCHVFEYEPVGNESPTFLELWRKKWGE